MYKNGQLTWNPEFGWGRITDDNGRLIAFTPLGGVPIYFSKDGKRSSTDRGRSLLSMKEAVSLGYNVPELHFEAMQEPEFKEMK